MGRLGTVINTVSPIPVGYTVGTVASVDMETLSCTVDPEDGGEPIRNIPLRVTRESNAYGVTIVPSVGTEAVVVWLDRKGSENTRPSIYRVQKWDRVMIHDDHGFGVTITAQADLKLGSETDATHPLGWGDIIADQFDAIKAVFDAHIHGAGPPTGTPFPATPDMESDEVFTS